MTDDKKRHHPLLGELDSDGPSMLEEDPAHVLPPAKPSRPAEPVEETVIEAPYVPEPISVRRTAKRILVAGLERVLERLKR